MKTPSEPTLLSVWGLAGVSAVAAASGTFVANRCWEEESVLLILPPLCWAAVLITKSLFRLGGYRFERDLREGVVYWMSPPLAAMAAATFRWYAHADRGDRRIPEGLQDYSYAAPFGFICTLAWIIATIFVVYLWGLIVEFSRRKRES